MASQSMHLSFESDIAEFVRVEAAKRGYRGPSEFNAEILRREKSRMEAQEKFDAFIQAGLDSPLSGKTVQESSEEIRAALRSGKFEEIYKKKFV